MVADGSRAFAQLLTKERVGSKDLKKCDFPKTLSERLKLCTGMTEERLVELKERCKSLEHRSWAEPSGPTETINKHIPALARPIKAEPFFILLPCKLCVLVSLLQTTRNEIGRTND